MNVLSEGLRITLSSYALAINKMKRRRGSLFTQNSKIVLIESNNKIFLKNELNQNATYLSRITNYIHQSPWRQGFVLNPSDWMFSSFKFYTKNDKVNCLVELGNLERNDITLTDQLVILTANEQRYLKIFE